ncbi:hypothetical protein VTN77DRAFT_1819 [Rasamsonia byssochlamydoides]|uniref:uncharacterized protein n=1 Tax=Rasamsonia byssochlamydoides TaxID=89139 RepID=UPI003744B171
MAFPYKKVLVLGATSGIGLAIAERLIQQGIFVIAVGRRKENLDAFVRSQGAGRAAGIQFDITKLDAIPAFVQDVTKSHPDLDCAFLNSGIQRRSVFSEPEAINMDVIVEEMTTNYLSYLALTKEFLPFFTAKKDTPTSLIFTTSGLALVPILRCSNYCASKAALHQWILCLREQLKGTNVKVIEIMPPAVQTELHDAKHQPDIIDGRKLGMPLEDFTNETMEKLLQGAEQIPVGLSKPAFEKVEKPRQEMFQQRLQAMKM